MDNRTHFENGQDYLSFASLYSNRWDGGHRRLVSLRNARHGGSSFCCASSSIHLSLDVVVVLDESARRTIAIEVVTPGDRGGGKDSYCYAISRDLSWKDITGRARFESTDWLDKSRRRRGIGGSREDRSIHGWWWSAVQDDGKQAGARNTGSDGGSSRLLPLTLARSISAVAPLYGWKPRQPDLCIYIAAHTRSSCHASHV